MTKRLRSALTLGLVLLVVAGVTSLAVAAVAVNAGTPCTPVAQVGGRYSPYANVRETPSTSSKAIGRLYAADTPAPSDLGWREPDGTWWHLCSGGYVRDDVVNAVTITASRLAPSAQVVTQTPAPTTSLNVLVMGTTVPCTNPCAFFIYSGTLAPTPRLGTP